MPNLLSYIPYLENQENMSCCSASAALLCLEIHYSIENRYKHLSRLFTYYYAREMQDRLGKVGVGLGAAFDSIVKYGAAPNAIWASLHQRTNSEPSQIAKLYALPHKIQSFDQIEPSNFNKMIDNKTPIAIGLQTGRKFWKIKGNLEEQDYSPINTTDNRQSNGHAVVIVGYDDKLNNGSWIIANSLGPTWGDKGIGILPYECSVDIGESYVITSF